MDEKKTRASLNTTLNVLNADEVIATFEQAAALNLNDPLRQGSTAVLPQQGHLLMTGDLHDNGLNYERILKLADLEKSTSRHLILHEVIHGIGRVNGCDLSIRMLAKVADLKIRFPKQVHIMLGNHELAQYGHERIMKDGVSLIRAFEKGIEYIFPSVSDQVTASMNKFIGSLLMAVRCPNGIFCCHSLPSSSQLAEFDHTLPNRKLEPADLLLGGHAYHMVWGRAHPQALADELAQRWDAELFVLGHQYAEMGYCEQGDSMLILASDHSHGVVLPIELDQKYSREELIEQIIPLACVPIALD